MITQKKQQGKYIIDHGVGFQTIIQNCKNIGELKKLNDEILNND